MKKLLLNIGLGSLAVGGVIATPLTLTSCSKGLGKLTINLDEVVEKDDTDTWVYNHNFYGNAQEGEMQRLSNLTGDGYIGIFWNAFTVESSTVQQVVFIKSKDDAFALAVQFAVLYQLNETQFNKLKKGETISFNSFLGNADISGKLKLMLLTNFDEVLAKISIETPDEQT